MAEFLAEEHQVEIITAFPYYPQWKIWKPFQKKSLFLKEKKDNLTIYRSRQYVPSNPSLVKRILLMISFTIGAFFNLFRLKNKPDLVISVIPFTSSAFLGLLCKWFRGSKVWIHIQDFEFDIAINSGIIKKIKFFQRPILGIERFFLDKSDYVSTISHSMMVKLKSKSKSETYLLPNWIEEKFIQKNEDGKRHPYLKEGKFNVLYSGSIGAKQDWRFFIKVATALSNEKDIVFNVIGDGGKRNELEQNCKGLKNVSFFPPVAYEELPLLLSSADMHILFQKNDVIDSVMPSKLLGMLASGRVSVITGNKESEVRSIIEDNNIGFYAYSGSVKEVTDFILKVQRNPLDFTHHSRRAQEYVIENFSKTKVLSKFRVQLNSLFRQ